MCKLVELMYSMLLTGWKAQRSHEAEDQRCCGAHVHKSTVPVLLALTHGFLYLHESRYCMCTDGPSHTAKRAKGSNSCMRACTSPPTILFDLFRYQQQAKPEAAASYARFISKPPARIMGWFACQSDDGPRAAATLARARGSILPLLHDKRPSPYNEWICALLFVHRSASHVAPEAVFTAKCMRQTAAGEEQREEHMPHSSTSRRCPPRPTADRGKGRRLLRRYLLWSFLQVCICSMYT
ncbi:hypothetical protein M441DRAFT_256306 [Trichoderma asperellum CBS 433.97]|uniref:Uncharacterized protein n=1 Tax=Trichoderma asperellum (strain ATCC 204424 / CBS 433.97 / NBRC 101777) TaxID=1042311 RepID=A0A2T3YYW4_TRIA4|nr:hypothetical protein M441DRAFT_256306 [Trichoderma asperellum CBS 433.97]PTB37710.1 hypothetical protein M441DRAFT_256306 [Trichoderma asperellum CBS 433.97]